MELQTILPLELCQLIMIKKHKIGLRDIQRELLDIQEDKDILDIQLLEQNMLNDDEINFWTLNEIIFLRNVQQLII